VKFTNPYEWEDVVLPFEYFIRTNCGAEYLRQNAPNMESISSFGVLLADNLPGPFNLDVESIKTVTFEGLPADIQADPSRQLTRNIYDPKKKRIDWQQDKNFGFGFDMGSGMIETADKYYGRNRGNGGSQFTLNSSWVLQPVENSNQKLKR
jgi:hypothetical protein